MNSFLLNFFILYFSSNPLRPTGKQFIKIYSKAIKTLSNKIYMILLVYNESLTRRRNVFLDLVTPENIFLKSFYYPRNRFLKRTFIFHRFFSIYFVNIFQHVYRLLLILMSLMHLFTNNLVFTCIPILPQSYHQLVYHTYWYFLNSNT